MLAVYSGTPAQSKSDVTVMVVDDDFGALTLIEVMLQRNGFTVLTANGAQAALETLESVTPDLFVLDIMMPEIDGVELCSRLREKPETSRTPVLMLTAVQDYERVQASLDAGANGYLNKPVLPNDLAEAVRSLLE
jgi:DNA-binding response OmpR family regulator